MQHFTTAALAVRLRHSGMAIALASPVRMGYRRGPSPGTRPLGRQAGGHLGGGRAGRFHGHARYAGHGDAAPPTRHPDDPDGFRHGMAAGRVPDARLPLRARRLDADGARRRGPVLRPPGDRSRRRPGRQHQLGDVDGHAPGRARHAPPARHAQRRAVHRRRRGYPFLLQTGESYKGVPLRDRQHPHDLFMELSARYEVSVDEISVSRSTRPRSASRRSARWPTCTGRRRRTIRSRRWDTTGRTPPISPTGSSPPGCSRAPFSSKAPCSRDASRTTTDTTSTSAGWTPTADASPSTRPRTGAWPRATATWRVPRSCTRTRTSTG